MKNYNRKDDETLLELLDLKDAGYNYKEIAEITGLSRFSVSRKLRAVVPEMELSE